jgi:hypothetical protein
MIQNKKPTNYQKHKKYYAKYNKYYYLKKMLENPNYNRENYQKRKQKIAEQK